MYKLFTLKDFILYNTPCFSCGGKIKFQLMNSYKHLFNECFKEIKDSYIISTLQYKYKSNQSIDLKLNIKNNKFETSNDLAFKKYLKEKSLFLTNRCPSCDSYIITNNLEFDDLYFIKAITIKREIFSIHDDNKEYFLISDFGTNETKISISSKQVDDFINIKLPLLPLYKFKNKQNIIKKIRIYTAVS